MAPFLLRSLIIFACTAVADNTYESDGALYWKSTSPFHPQAGQTYGSVFSLTGTYMQFKLVIHDWTPYEYNAMFRISTTTDYVSCDRGLPSLWLTSNRQLKIGIEDRLLTDCVGNYVPEWTYLMLFDTIYDIVVRFNETHIYTSVNDEPYYDGPRPERTMADQLNTLKYINIAVDYGGQYPIANATLYDIILLSYDETDPFPQDLLDELQATTTTTAAATTASIDFTTTQLQETYTPQTSASAVEPITTSQITDDEQGDDSDTAQTQTFPLIHLVILMLSGIVMILFGMLIIWWYWNCQAKKHREAQYSSNVVQAAGNPPPASNSQVEMVQNEDEPRYDPALSMQVDHRPLHRVSPLIQDNNNRPNLDQLQLSAGSGGDSMYEKPEGQPESLQITADTTRGNL